MNALKCLIIDDEAPATKVLERYVQQIDGLTSVGSCRNAMEALSLMNAHPIDLIFLDIQMPGITGIEFIKSLNQPLSVILTTAYREYAVEGFELNVTDYLVKPISFERFFRAVSKVFQQVRTTAVLPPAEPISEFQSYVDMYMYVRVEKKMQKVQLKDIHYIESMGDYVKIILSDQQLITHLKIGYLEKKLPVQKFIRIHRSYIVAKDKIQSFTANSIEVASKNLPIGGNYRTQFHSVLGKFAP